MNLSVIKFGGTSLSNIKLMNNAVNKVIQELSVAERVIVVVSAMAGVTDHLVSEVHAITELDSSDKYAEYSNVITTGEQVSAGLFTLLLQNNGIKARSWLGWQAGIFTDENYEDSQIMNMNYQEMKESLQNDYQVAVVAGFQGVSKDKRITTLGRGGSDTTAIALAGALECKKCKIYTDVEGVFTADPRIVAKARKIDVLNFDEMIILAKAGAKVLQARSAELAKKYQTTIEVLSSFIDTPGTIINNNAFYHPVLGISLNNKSNNSEFVKVSIIGNNIDKNNDLIHDINKILSNDIININLSSTSIDLDVKDENKFSFLRELHSICNLE